MRQRIEPLIGGRRIRRAGAARRDRSVVVVAELGDRRHRGARRIVDGGWRLALGPIDRGIGGRIVRSGLAPGVERHCFSSSAPYAPPPDPPPKVFPSFAAASAALIMVL